MPATAIVPVKALDLAKSRLALPPGERRQLALAFATDTLDALLACPDIGAVVVITADPDVAALAAARQAHVVPDSTDSLDAAIADAVARSGMPSAHLPAPPSPACVASNGTSTRRYRAGPASQSTTRS